MSVAIGETNFNLSNQVGEKYPGKVGDVYTVGHPEAGELLAVVRTDRISAFDVVLPPLVPDKGQVLNEMSAELLRGTSSVAPNWLLGTPDANVSVGHKAKPIKVEMIMRANLLGSSWAAYSKNGMRDLCGNDLPDGMVEFQPFGEPLVTPTTKALKGHDENITPAEILASGLATEEEYEAMAEMSRALFAEGQAMAAEKGLVLADTKYEFGRLATGLIVAIDEVHTPDSSRYFPRDEFDAYVNGETQRRPEQLSKEFVREWLVAQGFKGNEGQVMPEFPDEFVASVSARYIDLYERMLGHSFVSAQAGSVDERLEEMHANIEGYLATL